jgi:hypothetical protein
MIKEQLEKMSAFDGEILLADGFDDCIVGVTLRDDEWVALYDASRITEKLALDMSYEEAVEYFGTTRRVAWWAYDLADAMLSVRDEPKQTLQKKEKK